MWYVIWTSTAREDSGLKLINERFADLVDRAFVPKRTISRKYGKEWRMEESALFPGYFFIDAPENKIEDIITRLHSFSDFNMVLSTDGKILPLTGEEAEFADKLYSEGGNFDMSVGIIVGDKITVTGGPLIGLEGHITKINRHKRIAYVDLKMFGKKTQSIVGLEIVERLSPDSAH